MGEHPSYHQVITRDEAERRLRQRGGRCYLTRYTEKHKSYVLSVYEHRRPQDSIQHFKLAFKEEGRMQVGGTGMIFDNIQSLLEHYEQNRLNYNFKNIGQAYTESDYIWDEEKKERLEERLKKGKERWGKNVEGKETQNVLYSR